MDKIVSVLNDNSDIQEVFDYARGNFDGSPVAIVTPSENTADYETTAENERIYAFDIILYMTRSKASPQSDPERTTDVNMRTLVESVLDDFDKDFLFTGLTVPTGKFMINVFAAPGNWGYSGRDDQYRAVEISIRCRVLVDVTNIS